MPDATKKYVYDPYDNLSIQVFMHADGRYESAVIASIAESIDIQQDGDMARFVRSLKIQAYKWLPLRSLKKATTSKTCTAIFNLKLLKTSKRASATKEHYGIFSSTPL